MIKIHGMEAAILYVLTYNPAAWNATDPGVWLVEMAKRMRADHGIRSIGTGGLLIQWDDDELEEFRVFVNPELAYKDLA